MLRTLWVSRLPVALQPIMATQKNVTLDNAAELADTVADTLTTRPSIAETSKPDNHISQQLQQMQQEISALREQIANIHIHRRNRSDSSSRSRSRSRTKRDVCWYHHRFGNNATKCTKPCSWTSPTENTLGNH